ncbi:MAG: DEAD/DEAH box helicase family protein, partial [Bacteroidota bacterium]
MQKSKFIANLVAKFRFMLFCFHKIKLHRFIYRESRVTEELDVAAFLKSIWTEGLNTEENQEFLRNEDAINDVNNNISHLRDDLRIQFLTTLENENPYLYARYKRISEIVRKRVKEVLAGFTNITDMNLPEGFTLRPKQEALLPKIQEYFADGTKRTGFIKHPPGMGKTHMMGLMIRSLAKHGKIRCLILSPRDTINKQNETKIQKMQEKGITVKDIFEIQPGEEPDVTVGTYQHAALEAEKGPEDSAFGDYDVIFLDECHRGFGPKLLQLLRTKYPDKIIIGLSATPYLGATSAPKKLRSAFQYFEGQIDDISLKDACNDGDLAPICAMQ